jgi:parallel beta-helix repeat protein
MSHSAVFTNSATVNGGGVWMYHTSQPNQLTIIASSISNNASTDSGGGLHIGVDFTSADFVDIIDSTFSGNVAEQGVGGGIYVFTCSKMSLSNSTVSGNRGLKGGGIHVHLFVDQLNISHSTIADNWAADQGGGLYIRTNDTTGIRNSLVAANSTESGQAASIPCSAHSPTMAARR